jgi:hyaluronoglucosaminidase
MKNKMKIELGMIEGFYGAPWSWETRKEYIKFLKSAGYAFYFYAPKADAYLRRKWREEMPLELVAELKALSQVCKDEGIAFGVGFSPYEIYVNFDDEEKKHLLSRINLFNEIGIDRLAILFDDMKNAPGLAKTQAEILHWVKERSTCFKLLMCPTYYSLDPILDQMFGARPADYLSNLGKYLDPSIDLFWTGEEICSKSYTLGHLQSINAQIGRRVSLWDNYPVNDGPKMCKFLHVNAFTNRPATLANELSSHFVNPMNQPWLSKIPMLTLRESYELAENYHPELAFKKAVAYLANDRLANQMSADIEKFQKLGLDQLPPESRRELADIYAQFNHPIANEIIQWLNDKYTVTRDVFLTQ